MAQSNPALAKQPNSSRFSSTGNVSVQTATHSTTTGSTNTRKSRDLSRDMEALRLSRQDNPYLQCLASREASNDDGEMQDDADAASLITKDNNEGLMKVHEALSLLEIHEHMIRSPPPLSIPDQQESRFQYNAVAEIPLHKKVVGSRFHSKESSNK